MATFEYNSESKKWEPNWAWSCFPETKEYFKNNPEKFPTPKFNMNTTVSFFGHNHNIFKGKIVKILCSVKIPKLDKRSYDVCADERIWYYVSVNGHNKIVEQNDII